MIELRKSILPFVIAIAILSCMLTPFAAYADGAALRLGDCIQLGKYGGQPILWRYVLDDENGKLFFSDNVLCRKPYDKVDELYRSYENGFWGVSEETGEMVNPATGENFTEKEIGSHARGAYARLCDVYAGSNYWGDSNIRSWLNSSADAGQVKWLCGIPPAGDFENESGFLSGDNFSEAELSLIKPVVLGTAVDEIDREKANHVGEDGLLMEFMPERVFLPDAGQIRDAAGNINDLTRRLQSDGWGIWLREPYTELIMSGKQSIDYVYVKRLIFDTFKNDIEVSSAPSDMPCGIMPAFYLNEDGMNIVSGSGAAGDPYVLTSAAVGETRRVSVSKPAHDVTVNGVKFGGDNEPPTVVYNNITYLPMTPEVESFVGISAEEDVWFKSLKIVQNTAQSEEPPTQAGALPDTSEAEVADGFLAVDRIEPNYAVLDDDREDKHGYWSSYSMSKDNTPVDNKSLDYPILRYNGVLYLPLTWDLAHDSLGWDYSYDEANGLAVNTGSIRRFKR